MNTSEEHKELSEIEATANQGLPISGKQHSKELWKEETSSSLSLFPLDTFSHYRLHSPLSMTSDVHWASRRKTGEVIHFKRDVKAGENQEKKTTLTDQQQSPENTRSSDGPSEKNSA